MLAQCHVELVTLEFWKSSRAGVWEGGISCKYLGTKQVYGFMDIMNNRDVTFSKERRGAAR